MKIVNSLESCLAVIALLAEQARSMRLSDIADTHGLPRSGTHRLLASLCAPLWRGERAMVWPLRRVAEAEFGMLAAS